MNKAEGRIIVFRIGSIGDTVIALPGFHAIRRSFPHAEIHLLTNALSSTKTASAFEVLGNSGEFVDNVIDYNLAGFNPIKIAGLLRRLRRVGASQLIYMMPVRSRLAVFRDRIFFFLAGIPSVLCMPMSYDRRTPRTDPLTGELEREASRIARSLSDIYPIDLNEPEMWDLRLSKAERIAGDALVRNVAKPFLAINMGGKVQKSDWGLDRWISFIRRFRSIEPNSGLVILGGPHDSERAQHLIAESRSSALDLCGRISVRESAAVLTRAKLFVGHDSGPLHLASCVTPAVIGLFGDNNPPKLWHPFGDNVRIIHDMQGVPSIAVSDVFELAMDLWMWQSE